MEPHHDAGKGSCVPNRASPNAISKSRVRRVILLTSVVLASLFSGSSVHFPPVRAQEGEPIAATGHGGFFDQKGRQIPVDLDFVAKAQAWYRARLLENLSAAEKSQFASFEQFLVAGLKVGRQDQLILQHHALEWLLANTKSQSLKLKTSAKLRALRGAMQWKLPETGGDLRIPDKREPFTPDPEVARRIKQSATQFRIGDARRSEGVSVNTATINSGQAYIDECRAAGVPIPPNINVMDPAGLAGWKSQGFIPQDLQFIIGTPAELRSYKSLSPEGMCFALPRYADASKSTVNFDGVVCMGRQSSKVCFWDNQWTNPDTGVREVFSFPAGQQIPIGVPAVPGGKYQAGGKEIEGGDTCTDCHAGENPFIIHPKADLDPDPGRVTLWETLSQPPESLPTKSVNRYIPLVADSWPQNQFSHAGTLVPAECSACHIKPAAGRFPHLSNQLTGYCNTVLPRAIERTMPPYAPGSAAAAATAFKDAYCRFAANADAADVGEPHITTTNGVNYDFQAAGEFTVLENVDSKFELQARQSPVITAFAPGANPYTGLGGCVSLNTAVAMRVGKRRITYQRTGPGSNGERLGLRIDGVPVNLSKAVDLGGGNMLLMSPNTGEIELRHADGTRVIVTPWLWGSQGYWYVNLQVFNTPARQGIMGPVLAGDWLPRAPHGSSFGAMPAALLDRHFVLNGKFADAWRVTNLTSLFDYAPGTSTATFTDRNWPAEPGKGCTTTTVPGPIPKVSQPAPELAKQYCAGIKDKAKLANCIFDVTVMADPGAAQGYHLADKRKQEELAPNP